MKVLQKKCEAKPAVFLNVKPPREREGGSDMTNKKAKKAPKTPYKKAFFGRFCLLQDGDVMLSDAQVTQTKS